MKNIIFNKKFVKIIISAIIIIMVFPTTLASEKILDTNIDIHNDSEIKNLNIDNQVEIEIHGTIYMMINKPLGQMLGLYGRFENKGSNIIDAYFGLSVKTVSINPMNLTIKTYDTLELPPGSVAEMPFTAPLGIGLFTITYFIEGAIGYDEDFYAEKTANGICFGFFQFLID